MRHQKPATPGSSGSALPFIVDHEFGDVDELAEVTKSWDLDFRQLNRGGFKGSVCQVVTESIHFADTRLDGVLHQRGATPRDVWTICFPGVRNMEFRWRGHDVGESDLLIHQPGGEFDSFSKRNFKLLLISVPPEHLEAAARRLGVPFAGGALDGLEIITSASWIVNHLRYLVTTALEALVEGRSIPDVVEQRASNLLIQGLSPGIRIDPRIRRTRRHELMEAAVRLARDRAHEIHSVKDLSKASGGSERTLRRGFNERFGVSPKNYLQAQRLIGARRDLRSSGRGTTVSDIANRWGFWHMGQFAADYKRQFGELPSETLQRRLGFL